MRGRRRPPWAVTTGPAPGAAGGGGGRHHRRPCAVVAARGGRGGVGLERGGGEHHRRVVPCRRRAHRRRAAAAATGTRDAVVEAAKDSARRVGMADDERHAMGLVEFGAVERADDARRVGRARHRDKGRDETALDARLHHKHPLDGAKLGHALAHHRLIHVWRDVAHPEARAGVVKRHLLVRRRGGPRATATAARRLWGRRGAAPRHRHRGR